MENLPEKPIRVLFIAAEADPIIKVGGLGDVAGSLPQAIRGLSSESTGGVPVDIRLAIPFHPSIAPDRWQLEKILDFSIPGPKSNLKVQVYSTVLDGLPVYLIGGDPIKPGMSVYNLDTRKDADKFVFFSLAVLEMARMLDWMPDILHANDWHTALSVYLLSLQRSTDPFFQNCRSILTLHNLPFMGRGTEDTIAAFHIPPLELKSMPSWAWDLPLPMGLAAADHIVAVSPHYAKEILTPDFGCDLQDFLKTRASATSGILNGLDQVAWNPETDRELSSTFSSSDLEKRRLNKIALQQEFNLPVEADTPLFVLISRMDRQKGVDIAIEALQAIKNQNWQAILLGTGDPVLESACNELANEIPDRVRSAIRFDSRLSHRMYAGADMILMPSRYEPCGLAQMIAMRYGCVPIARATGGLVDTIQDESGHASQTGYLFQRPTPRAMVAAFKRALADYSIPDKWRRLQENGMALDFSWKQSAIEYVNIYRSLLQ